jgi:cation diffusion facilitator family transporter
LEFFGSGGASPQGETPPGIMQQAEACGTERDGLAGFFLPEDLPSLLQRRFLVKLEKRRMGYLEGLLSAVINSGLFGMKIWVGTRAGSVAMVADAWHTLSDTLTSLVVIFGFWISSRPKDQAHPFGHGRAELIAAVVIGTMLALVGLNFLRDSYHRLRSGEPASFATAAVLVFAVSVAVKEALAQFSIRVGRRYDSQSLVADGWHHRSDAIASALILLGALFGRNIWWIDGALGIAVSLLILYAAYEIVTEAANSILGERPSEDVTRKIQALVAASAPEISDVHHIHMHRYGDHVEVTLHARVRQGMSLEAAHALASTLEDRLRADLKLEATIHLEPAPGVADR